MEGKSMARVDGLMGWWEGRLYSKLAVHLMGWWEGRLYSTLAVH